MPIFDVDLAPAGVGANIANYVWVDCKPVEGYTPMFSVCVTGEYIDSSASVLEGDERRQQLSRAGGASLTRQRTTARTPPALHAHAPRHASDWDDLLAVL